MNFQLRRHILKELFSQGHLRMKTLLLASMEPAAFFVELGNDVRRPMTKAGESPLVLEQLDKLHRRPRTVAELLASFEAYYPEGLDFTMLLNVIKFRDTELYWQLYWQLFELQPATLADKRSILTWCENFRNPELTLAYLRDPDLQGHVTYVDYQVIMQTMPRSVFDAQLKQALEVIHGLSE